MPAADDLAAAASAALASPDPGAPGAVDGLVAAARAAGDGDAAQALVSFCAHPKVPLFALSSSAMQ
jgi:hypothetical protein